MLKVVCLMFLTVGFQISAQAQQKIPATAEAKAQYNRTVPIIKSETNRRFPGWTFAEDTQNGGISAISPKSDPLYPSLVFRYFAEVDGKIRMASVIMCQNTTEKCEHLREQVKIVDRDVQQKACKVDLSKGACFSLPDTK